MKLLKLFTVCLGMVLLSSCASTKKIAYLQNSQDIDYEQSKYLYDAKIMPKDILTITISTVNPEAAAPFNLTVPTVFNQNRSSTYSQPTIQSYLVDNNGQIEFPVVGMITVGGLTKSECENLVLSKIKPYLNENERPVVTVRMINYKISVLGEVAKPGMFTVDNEKINILEALAKAGDLTIYGVRNKVKLIREDETGKKQIYTLNLNDASLVNSPYYYLQQNDIVYVEPNKVKSRNSNIGSSTTIWFSATSILISLTSLLYNILK
jgi:polysaccharide export outer membrane protein